MYKSVHLQPMKILTTIMTCFNYYGTRSSDAQKIKRRQQNPGDSKIYATHLDAPSVKTLWRMD